MAKKHIRVLGGACGTSRFRVAEKVKQMCIEEGWREVKVTQQDMWESSYIPNNVDLLIDLVLFPGETKVPIVRARRLVVDIDDPQTTLEIKEALRRIFEDNSPGKEVG